MCFSCTLLFLLQCVTTYISFFVHYQKSAQIHTQWQSVMTARKLENEEHT